MPAHERSLWFRLVGDCFRLVVVVSISLCVRNQSCGLQVLRNRQVQILLFKE